jgi:hypothetical protein
VDQGTVSKWRRRFGEHRVDGLQPYRIETFKLSTDPDFVVKARDVVGLYVSPPQHAVVLCVDEKSQIQALDPSRPMLPMRPGQPARRSHDYTRHAALWFAFYKHVRERSACTTSLFAALDIATSKVIGKCHSRHRATEFLSFLTRSRRPSRAILMSISSWTTTPRTKHR